MTAEKHFDHAKKSIVSEFDPQKVYTYKEIAQTLYDRRQPWRLPKNITPKSFIHLLLTKAGLRLCEFNLPKTRITRYVWHDPSLFRLAVSLRHDSYLTHYSAMYLHNLTEQVSSTIYVNAEQQDKPFQDAKLSQESIDRAFSRSPRVTTNIAGYADNEIYLLNGKFSKKLGVIEMLHGTQEMLPVSGLERTLVDITVRPIYSGGIHEVLKAYKNAASRVSVDKLVKILRKLDYIYPYHQAIGFYLERSGVYHEDQISLIEKFPKTFDFYLDYQMKKISYSKRWKLHYPKDI